MHIYNSYFCLDLNCCFCWVYKVEHWCDYPRSSVCGQFRSIWWLCYWQTQERQSDDRSKKEQKGMLGHREGQWIQTAHCQDYFMDSGLTIGWNFAVKLTYILEVDISHFHTFPVENYLKAWYLKSLSLGDSPVFYLIKQYSYIWTPCISQIRFEKLLIIR